MNFIRFSKLNQGLGFHLFFISAINLIVLKKIILFTKDDTAFAKGIALILLLIHHLFFKGAGIRYEGLYIGGFEIYSILSLLGKVCITIFVILSGYGLSESFKSRKEGYLKFIYRHTKKIYLNYWFFWLVFVPIGIFFFGRTLSLVYGDPLWPKLLINFFGMQELFRFYGYNPTWWFVTLIVLLYLLFPILNLLVEKLKAWSLVLFTGLMYLNLLIDINKFPLINVLYIYMASFALGIYLSKTDGLSKITSYFSFKKSKWFIYPIVLGLFTLLRIFVQLKVGVLEATKLDAVYGLAIILFSHQFFRRGWLTEQIRLIGVHSFNIFLFHTFIYSLFLSSLIYWLRYPPSIFIVLLFSCLIISIGLEYIRAGSRKYILNPLLTLLKKI